MTDLDGLLKLVLSLRILCGSVKEARNERKKSLWRIQLPSDSNLRKSSTIQREAINIKKEISKIPKIST